MYFERGEGEESETCFHFYQRLWGGDETKKQKKRAIKSFDQIVKRIFVPHLCKQHNKTYPKSSDPGQTPSPQKQQKQKEQKKSPRGNVKIQEVYPHFISPWINILCLLISTSHTLNEAEEWRPSVKCFR